MMKGEVDVEQIKKKLRKRDRGIKRENNEGEEGKGARRDT